MIAWKPTAILQDILTGLTRERICIPLDDFLTLTIPPLSLSLFLFIYLFIYLLVYFEFFLFLFSISFRASRDFFVNSVFGSIFLFDFVTDRHRHSDRPGSLRWILPARLFEILRDSFEIL